jgi:Zn-dependent protease
MPAPREIFNCPQCSHYIQPGTLACPDCHAMVYSQYLQGMAQAAQTFEDQQRWPEARAAWQAMLGYLPAGTQQAVAVGQQIGKIDARFSAKAARKAAWTKRLGPLAPVLVFLGKIKLVIPFLLKFKFILSFVAFFGIYWGLFGWKFGLGFVVGILIHEMGHYVAAKRRGLSVDLPVFIPGMGAYVKWRSQGTTFEDLAAIALAGPFFGLLAALAFATAVFFVPADLVPLFSALTHVTAWLNLLNLIPLFWLDGAMATYGLNRLQRGMLAATGVVFFAATGAHEWVFLLIAGGMAWQAFQPAPETESGKTLMRFVGLFFLLGTLIWLFPDTGRRF